MTGLVVLLNRHLPTLIPVDAIDRLVDTEVPVFVTAELPSVVGAILDAAPTTAGTPFDAVVVSSDPTDHTVLAYRTAGAEVIIAPHPQGMEVLDAIALIDMLRSQGPWESEQTHASLLRYLVEETYELADAVIALDAADASAPERAELRSELGDLLLQVIFHARIAEEADRGAFGIDAIARTLTDKIRRRTPHLVDGTAVDVATQAENWERQKRAERTERGENASILDSVSLNQPALALAGKVFERLRSAGFPAELVPTDVRAVTLDPTTTDHSPELDYRRRLLVFLADVRRAERLLASGRCDCWASAWADADREP